MLCPECERDFPQELLHDLVTGKGRRKMCPLCGLRERNRMAGLPPDAPFQGGRAKEMYDAALAHLTRAKAKEN